MSWPITGDDGLLLPDGRCIGQVPTAELQTILVEIDTPGAAHENGRATNIKAYAEHIYSLKDTGGTVAVDDWLVNAKRRAAPREITFRQVDEKIFVVDGWPKQALFDEVFLASQSNHVVVNGTVITIGVANGFASYRKRKQVGDAWLCQVSESEFVP